MRKVGGDANLEDRLGVYRTHLDRCRLEFDSVFASGGMEAALRSQAAQNLAQYGEVVRVLEGLSGEDPVESLARISREAVDALRGSDTPRLEGSGLGDRLGGPGGLRLTFGLECRARCRAGF